MLRIALIYPPPWKIPASGEAPDTAGDGPPAGHRAPRLEGDLCLAPNGLLSLAAQATRAGHQVRTVNLSVSPWPEVEEVVGGMEADLYGLSCFTVNRRGVALVAECIRRLHPKAHIVVGGPHVSVLPRETLEYYDAIDTVVIGEGETTFLELIGRIEAGEPTRGLAGTAWRAGGEVRIGPPRERIKDLDSLACLHDYFPCFTVLTSRGCPARCTFCASNAIWGRKMSYHSVEYVLDALEATLARLPVKMLAVKDDTFTLNRRRVLELCRGIRERNLNFLWSCDTRVDVVDEELLREMRLAGCQMISLGVESASAAILESINKKITPDKVVEVTQMAKAVGLQVRYYMIAGNRGETVATFQESIDFLQAAKPHEFVFCVLSIYPGTAEFEALRHAEEFITACPGPKGPKTRKRVGPLTSDVYFEEDFMELWAFPDTPPEDIEQIGRWIMSRPHVEKLHRDTAAECEAVLERLPGLHTAHMDLGMACILAGQLDSAERHVRRSLELGHPIAQVGHNSLACIAAQKGDIAGAKAHLQRGLDLSSADARTAKNMEVFEAWLNDGGPESGRPLELVLHEKFGISHDVGQPVQPGPLG